MTEAPAGDDLERGGNDSDSSDGNDMPTEELISRVQLIEEQPLDSQATAFTQLHAELLQELQA